MNKKSFVTVFTGLLVAVFLIFGCSNNAADVKSSNEMRVIHFGYYGGICEAPVYAAYENGIFEKYGLTVKLVKISPSALKRSIASGKIDAVTITQDSFKDIAQGLPVKLTAGFHTSYIQAVVPVDSPIQAISDLKGKTIGIDNIGGPPMVYLSMELSRLGINPQNDVNWKVYPNIHLTSAMEKKEIDAFSAWEPFPQIAVDQGRARVFFRNTTAKSSSEQICCYVGISEKLTKDEPEIAKLLTKSLAEATEWVGNHPEAAAQLSVDKKYTWGDTALISAMLAQYHWISDPTTAKESYTNYLNVMKELHFLEHSIDVETLIRHSFLIL